MLMQLPKLNNSSDLKQLRQLLDKTEAAIQNTARVTSYFKSWYDE